MIVTGLSSLLSFFMVGVSIIGISFLSTCCVLDHPLTLCKSLRLCVVHPIINPESSRTILKSLVPNTGDFEFRGAKTDEEAKKRRNTTKSPFFSF